MYEKGDAGYAQMLMEAGSFADMLTKADYIEELYVYDRKMLSDYEQCAKETEALKKCFEEEEEALIALKKESETEKANMEGVLAELEESAAAYAEEIAEEKAEADRYEAMIAAKNAEIKRRKAEAERRAREEAKRREEERKKAEAAKKAAQEAARAAQNAKAAESSAKEARNSGTVTTGSGSYDISSISSAKGSEKGKNIAAFACKFIGNPYVPGGTSLTNGADCSGFVFSVYGEFGIKVPRTSYELRSAGKEVSYSDAQPGDVVCYPGHVGIYIGNGMIVHASTVKTGIKISSANYRDFITIRRIV